MVNKISIALVLLSVVACQRAEAPPPKTVTAPAPATTHNDAPAPGSYAPIVDRVAPSVVTIRSARRLRAPRQFPFFDDPQLREFFGRFFGERTAQGAPVRMGLGSGVIVRPDGYVLTNHHVIDGADEISVELSNRRSYPAKVIGSDPPSDLAVLKIDGSSLPALGFGNSDQVRVGDVVLALGNPLGIGQTVTSGIISAKSRSTGLSDGSFEDFLQTDAAINQGNSGGALVNTNGQLVGINSQILSPTGGNIGIGFAVPVNMASNVMEQLIATGKVERGQLGIGIQAVTPEIAGSLGMKETRGVIIATVSPNSAASRAGLRQGDVVVAFNDQSIVDGNTLRNSVASSKPGSAVRLTIVRDGKEETLNATLGEYRAENVAPPALRRRG